MVAKTLPLPNLRKLFVPDPGHIMCDIDLAGADAQVVAWEANDDDLKRIFRTAGDLHQTNADVLGCSRALAKRWVHGCVTPDHEVLTRDGWLSVADVDKNEPILVCNRHGEEAHFAAPRDWNVCYAQGEPFIHIEGQAISQLVTADHTLSYTTGDGFLMAEAQDLPKSARLPKSVDYSGLTEVPQANLVAAYHADGFEHHGGIRFNLRKERKVERLRKLLRAEDVPHVESETNGTYKFRIPAHAAWPILIWGKSASAKMLRWDAYSLDQYLYEQEHWDGHRNGNGAVWMSTVEESHADWCHTLSHLRLKGSQRQNPLYREHRKPLYRFSLNNRNLVRLESCEVSHVYLSTAIYCPVTSKGFWLTRRNGKISITGNTNYGGSPRTMAVSCGITMAQAERFRTIWFNAHPGIAEWHRNTEAQLRDSRTIHNRFGYRCTFFGRLSEAQTQALAWLPQSTVACITNRAWVTLEDMGAEVLLQVHDSLLFQLPLEEWPLRKREIHDALQISVPYDDPLTIPWGLKTSTMSWGDCKEEKWET